ncbi:hypothetical protein [Marinoscillum pacificum]|uniref:hypothetical protein n=1 Tax=Marinoscillum pacificum TaxID=392723 RepID=UPI0021574C83|nr:hypothetical protein [Marinoscillum pacificum]
MSQKHTKQDKTQSQKIIKSLSKIKKGSTQKYPLSNGNRLEIYRINEFYFQVRIEALRSKLAPVLICKIIDRTKFKTFPFIYLKGFLVLGIGGSVIALIFYLVDLIKSSAILIPMIISLGFQVLLLPLYFVILKFFKKTLS